MGRPALALEEVLKGYGGYEFPLPGIAGRYRGKSLIVVGDAACVWDDLERFGCRSSLDRGSVRKDGWDFLTVNKIVETFPGNIEHAYSNEAESLARFIAARRQEYRKEFQGPLNIHSCQRGAQWRWPWNGRGSSALGATLVGLGLGYAPVVLAGIPLDDGPHNGEPPWRRCQFRRCEVTSDKGRPNAHWGNAMALGFDGKVKSLSGRTKEWLGSP